MTRHNSTIPSKIRSRDNAYSPAQDFVHPLKIAGTETDNGGKLLNSPILVTLILFIMHVYVVAVESIPVNAGCDKDNPFES